MEQGERAFGLTRLLPFLFAIGGFTLLYAVVPARPVAFRHALAGGVVAGVLFAPLKAGFGFYMRQFPSSEAIYGAPAALPYFLVWSFLSWSILWLGAEVASA